MPNWFDQIAQTLMRRQQAKKLLGGNEFRTPSFAPEGSLAARPSPSTDESFEPLKPSFEVERGLPESYPINFEATARNNPSLFDRETEARRLLGDGEPDAPFIPMSGIKRDPNAPPDRRQVERGGIGGTLKHMGKGALLAIANAANRGGGLPELLGAAAGGATTGGISPQAVENYAYENITLPRWEREQGIRNEAAQREQTSRLREAQIANYEADNLRAAEQAKAIDADRQLQRELQVSDRGGVPVNPQIDRMMEGVFGPGRQTNQRVSIGEREYVLPTAEERMQREIETAKAKQRQVLPEPKFDAQGRPFYTEADAQGRPTIRPYPGGEQMAPKPPPRDPNALTPYQQTQLGRQSQQDYRARVKDANAIKEKFEKAKKRTGELAAQATRLQKLVDGSGGTYTSGDGKTTFTQDDVKRAWEQVDASRNEMQGHQESLKEFEDVYEVDESGVGYRKKAGASTPSSTGQRQSKTQKVASSSDLDAFAKEYFGGDKAKAAEYLKSRGYTIQ